MRLTAAFCGRVSEGENVHPTTRSCTVRAILLLVFSNSAFALGAILRRSIVQGPITPCLSGCAVESLDFTYLSR